MKNFSYKEVNELATNYAKYYISVREKLQQQPLGFDDFFDKLQVNGSINFEPQIDLVINRLNETLEMFGKRGYKYWGKTTRSPIRQKFNEGYTLSEMLDVIEAKKEWLGDTKMHKFFRPKTLFGNKFESYLNETTKPLEATSDDKFTNAYNEALNDNF